MLNNMPKKYDKKTKNKAEADRIMRIPRRIIADLTAGETDPNGSYTGAPVNRSEKPVQDADDL
ncbi:MAG: hypothetical protein FWH08_07005 [Oscillospiraceae bacterium]|nr:hypothetical protein [Oscillospiraceae bacterium]